MKSAFFHFQHTLNRLLNKCIKLYWYWICSFWNMKGVKLTPPPFPPRKGKTTIEKSSLIRVKFENWLAGFNLEQFLEVLGNEIIPAKSLWWILVLVTNYNISKNRLVHICCLSDYCEPCLKHLVIVFSLS